VSLVLDSSATLAWIYSDETTDAIRALFDQVADAGAVVPTLWRLEVANSMTVAIRRGRIDADFRRAALADLALLDIVVDQQTDPRAWGETLNLADRFRLTVYDAAYLELAQRRTLPLATLDDDLCVAAAALGVRLLGGRNEP
jgi:predicted nucleic acid-binding protein